MEAISAPPERELRLRFTGDSLRLQKRPWLFYLTASGGSPTAREGVDSMTMPSLTVGLPPLAYFVLRRANFKPDHVASIAQTL